MKWKLLSFIDCNRMFTLTGIQPYSANIFPIHANYDGECAIEHWLYKAMQINLIHYLFISCRIRSSMENLIDDHESEPLVTFPDGDSEEELQLDLEQAIPIVGDDQLQCVNAGGVDTVKFEQKRTTSASKTKVITDGFSSEQVSAANIFLHYNN